MNWTDLLAALCLVLVIEGLFLLVAPAAWKRIATQLAVTSERAMRVGGGVMILAGLIALQLVRA
ncbi:MAG TPA: DUF2065 family protein [Xanthomonadaceae bacterium]|jgi:uncharacterized protein YjeT (DUF2065 family)|nr:DUF2065 family protein [Xanthomonadaceae bacterium]